MDLTTGEVVRDAVSRVYSLEDRGALFMVADGMGGVVGGAVASEMAIETILGEVRHRRGSTTNGNPEAFAVAIRIAVERANAQIHDQAATHPAGHRMGNDVGHQTFVVGESDAASGYPPALANLLPRGGQALGVGVSWVLRICAAIAAVLVFILILYAVSTWRAGG